MLPIMAKLADIELNIRVGEPSDVSPLTRKKSKAKTTAAVKDHMLFCDHIVSFEDFKILAGSNLKFHLKIKGSLLIVHELNRNEKSLPLYLFDKCILTQILYLYKVLI